MSLTVAQILRMTLAASGLSRREIALRADLRPSRLERILGGYAVPSRDEYTMIVRACGCADVLSNYPVARPAARGLPAGAVALPARTVFGLLLNRNHHADVDTRVCTLCVDYLSLSFDADAHDLLTIARSGTRNEPKRPRYHWEYECSGVTVQHGRPAGGSILRHRRRNSRIAFNPSRLSHEGWIVVRAVRSLASRVRISRLDVAVDLPGRYQLLAGSRKVRLVVVGPDGVETFYIGVRKSDRQIRVYDKRRQLIDTGRADESHPELTRVEAQLRNLKLGLSYLLARRLRDPFGKLGLVELPSGLPFLHALGANYADAFGVQALRPLVSPSEFEVIVRHVLTSDAPHPSRVFADQWPRACRALLRNLGVS